MKPAAVRGRLPAPPLGRKYGTHFSAHQMRQAKMSVKRIRYAGFARKPSAPNRRTCKNGLIYFSSTMAAHRAQIRLARFSIRDSELLTSIKSNGVGNGKIRISGKLSKLCKKNINAQRAVKFLRSSALTPRDTWEKSRFPFNVRVRTVWCHKRLIGLSVMRMP